MRRLEALLLAITLGCSHIVAAEKPSRPSTAVAEIDVLCDRLARSTNDGKGPRLFAVIWEDQGDGEPKLIPWQEYAGDGELKRRLQTLGTYEVAEFWRFDDGTAYVRTTATSDTGDWLHLTRYCYRADGSLARTTFVATWYEEDSGIIGSRARYFTSSGHQIRSTSETKDEAGKKRKQHEFSEQEPLCKRVSEQPFASLLQ